MTANSKSKSFEMDIDALRAACSVIESLLIDIKRDYTQLEEEHNKFATNYKILSEQAKMMNELNRAAESEDNLTFSGDVADLDMVAMEAASAQLSFAEPVPHAAVEESSSDALIIDLSNDADFAEGTKIRDVTEKLTGKKPHILNEIKP